MKNRQGFTLIETIIVIVIVGILLAATFSLSFDYVDTMRVKTDKEQMANVITDAMAVARTSNYYDKIRYENIRIDITQSGVSSLLVGGEYNAPQVFDNFDLVNSEIVFATGVAITQLDIIPYDIGCEGSVNGVVSTGDVYFELHSEINDDIYCYEVQQDVCKLNQIVCP